MFSGSFGADAASAGEVALAKECGLDRSEIYYSAPGKSNNDLKAALDDSIIIADSFGEIERLQEYAAGLEKVIRIGVRLNPAFSLRDVSGNPSKFGIDEEDFFVWAGSAADLPNVEIIGLHVHLQSQILDEDLLARYYDKMFSLAERFSRLPGIRLEFLNLGSGMGIPYSERESELDTSRLGEIVNRRVEAFRKEYGDVKIIIEVGRYIAGPAGIFVTKVMDKKVSRGKTYLILKNTLNGFIRPSLACLIGKYSDKGAPPGCEPLFTSLDAFRFEVLKRTERGCADSGPAKDSEPVKDPGAAPAGSGSDPVLKDSAGNSLEKVMLAGNLCTSADVMAEDILLPELERGDLVIVKNAGSYAAVLSPMQFSSQERPAEIFVRREKIGE